MAWQAELDLMRVHFAAGRVAEAEAVCRRVLAVGTGPEMVEFHRGLGNCLARGGDAEAAIACYREAARCDPSSAAAFNSLGVALMGHSSGLGEAVSSLKRALELAPGQPSVLSNLGAALQRSGDLDGAARAFRAALAIVPQSHELHSNYGVVLRYQGDMGAAEEEYRLALRLRPDFAGAHNNLGIVLAARGRYEEALSHFTEAVKLNPRFPQAWLNLGNACSSLKRVGAAIGAFAQARELDPSLVWQLAHERRMACDWSHFEEEKEQTLLTLRSGMAEVGPFTLLNNDKATPEDQLLCARRATSRIEAMVPAPFVHEGRRTGRPIRVGYLSGDFHAHATAYLAAELFERHDRKAVEIFAYSFGPDDKSAMRARLRRAFDHFEDIRDLPHRAAAEKIRGDGIDILVDLKGHTRDARPWIPAWRPAPVQVNFLGFPGTTGARGIDYIIADPFVLPFDRQPFFSERIVHLPHCYQPNDSRREISPKTPSRAEAGLPPDGLVLCSFNGPFKIDPAIFGVWMGVLRALPEAVLWLLDANDVVKDNLRREAAARGVEPLRLVFAPHLPLSDHLARHVLADLFLDCSPCGAHTTASDALWTGLPLLTLTGETFASRVAGSLLRAVGLPELVTSSLEEYESLALALARSPERLADLRRKLLSGRASAPLFDAGAFARDIEAAFAHMMDLWNKGEPPRSFAVADRLDPGRMT